MRKALLSFIIAGFVSQVGAQITDTVSTGASYANQVWYSLENDEQGSAAMTSWDLAFEINGFSASIFVNASSGAELYKYPLGDTANWSNLDTLGFDNWTPWYNSTTSWSEGAFNRGIDTSDAFDLGWGKYSFITHQVTGDSLYVWKSANGNFKKIWIENLVSGTYNFKVANLDGTNLKQVALAKSNFQGKAFGYYSIAQDTILDIEPTANSWDLVFSKYIEMIPSPYSVSGIRTNSKIETAQVYPVNNPTTFNTYKSQNYSADINTIGHDWKYFDMGSFTYQIEDSTVYFVKTDSTTFWKLVMTGFGGSSNGNYIFTKEKMSQTSGLNDKVANVGSFTLYPNPSTNRNVQMVADFAEGINQMQMSVIDIKGQLVRQEQINVSSSFETIPLNLEGIDAGMYVIRLDHERGSISRKMILK